RGFLATTGCKDEREEENRSAHRKDLLFSTPDLDRRKPPGEGGLHEAPGARAVSRLRPRGTRKQPGATFPRTEAPAAAGWARLRRPRRVPARLRRSARAVPPRRGTTHVRSGPSGSCDTS